MFCNVIAWVVRAPRLLLPRARKPGRLTFAPIPVPLKLNTRGLPVALSVMVNVAVLVPMSSGTKEIPMVQEDAGATNTPLQVFELTKKS